jgi:hypothetical protein
MDDNLSVSRAQPDYLSYLLRLWRVSEDQGVQGGDAANWRASLESPHSGERVGFAGLEELFDFLLQQTGLASDIDQRNGEYESPQGTTRSGQPE